MNKNEHLSRKNNINFTGICESVQDVEEVISDNGYKFYRQGFLLRELNETYQQTVFLYMYSKTYKPTIAPEIGKLVCVEISITANVYKGKYYNNLKCWRFNYVRKED
jgi:hypothetical protein